MAQRADVIVLGMGVAGEELGGRLALAGLDVVGMDHRLVGGECPYWGCVPTKMMVRAANLLAEARRIPGMAGASTVRPDWEPVARRLRDEATDTWDDRVAVERFESKGGRFVRGTGRLEGPGRVSVGGTELVAERIVVASGTAPFVPPIPGLSDVPYWTSRDAVEAETLPGSLVVLGGGAVGVELGQAFARFRVRVTIVEAMERLLPPEEPESGDLVEQVLRREGVEIVTGAAAERVEPDGGGVRVILSRGGSVSGERLLVAVGRRADLAALNTGSVGLDPGTRTIAVDGRMRAGDGVWAVGDVTGAGPFTHVAMYQAGIAAEDILGRDPAPADYRALPRVTFTDPEVGSVGLTEQQAREKGLDVRTGSTQVPSTARGWIHKAGNEGFIKVVADAGEGVLVGATSAGPHGGEVLGTLALAIHARVPVAGLQRMIYAYPTFHRGIEDALRSLE